MAKIGAGSSSVGDQPRDPFRGLEHSLLGEDGVPTGLSWGVATRAIASELGQDWFEKLPSVPVSEWVRREAPSKLMPGREADASGLFVEHVESRAKQLDWYESGVVFPDLVRDSSSLGDLTPFSQSSLAPKILAYLARNGVSGEELKAISLGASIVPTDDSMMWLGGWGTRFGTRTFTWFDIRTDASGNESAYFHTNLVIATRPPELWLAEAFSVPAQAHALLFVGETPFPSAIFSMSRSVAWKDVPDDLVPTPFLSFVKNGLACLNFGNSGENSIEANYAGYPWVLTAGYLIPASSEAQFDEILPSVIDTLANLATIIEDGFRNFRNETTPVPFDHLLGSEYIMFEEQVGVKEGVSAGGHGRWIPETHMGSLVKLSRDTYAKAHSMEKGVEQEALFEWIVNEGAGGVVGGAINSLVYSYLLPAGEFERAEWYLKKAIAMEILYETSNALANLGQVYLGMGKRSEAREAFHKAMTDQIDRFAVSEASYYLGLMALEDGDKEEALQHFTVGAQEESEGEDPHRQLCRDKLLSDFS